MRHLPLFFALAALFPGEARAFTIQIDSVKRSSILPWASPEITFDVNPADCVAAGVTEAQLNASIDAAFALWNSASGSSLKLVRGAAVAKTSDEITSQTTGGNPLILCDAQLSAHLIQADGSPTPTNNIPAVTRILRVDGERRIALAVISLNAEEGRASNIRNIIRSPNLLEVVLAHELGHAIGLGHTSDPTALMYFDATAKQELSLGEDDMNGVTYLYPRKEAGSDGIFGCGTIRGDRGRKGGGDGAGFGWMSWALLLLACRLMVAWVKSPQWAAR